MKAALVLLIQLAASASAQVPLTDHQGIATLFAEPKCSTLLGTGLDAQKVVLKDRICYDATLLGLGGFHSLIFDYQEGFNFPENSKVASLVAVAAYADETCGKSGGKFLARTIVSEKKRTTACLSTKGDKEAKSIIFSPFGIPGAGEP